MLRPLLLMLALAAQVAHAQAPAPPVTPPVAPPVNPPAPKPVPTPTPHPAPTPVVPVAAIVAPESVPADAPLVLFADGSVSAGKLSWILVAPKVPFETFDAPGQPGGVLVIRKPVAGTVYRFVLVAYGTGNPPFAFDFADVPAGGAPTPAPQPTPVVPTPTPSPTPVPDIPTPAPQPTPVVPVVPTPLPPPGSIPLSFARPAWITLVVDSGNPATMTASLAAVRDSTTIAAKVAALNAHWLVIDVNSPEFARRNFAGIVALAGGVPCVAIQGTPPANNVPVPTVGRPFRIDGLGEDQVVAKIEAVMGGVK